MIQRLPCTRTLDSPTRCSHHICVSPRHREFANSTRRLCSALAAAETPRREHHHHFADCSRSVTPPRSSPARTSPASAPPHSPPRCTTSWILPFFCAHPSESPLPVPPFLLQPTQSRTPGWRYTHPCPPRTTPVFQSPPLHSPATIRTVRFRPQIAPNGDSARYTGTPRHPHRRTRPPTSLQMPTSPCIARTVVAPSLENERSCTTDQ